jgi:putative ABC transport system permease protein
MKLNGWIIGIRLLAFHPMRLFASFAGLAVAVVIMFIEAGLLQSILDAQSLIADKLRADLVVMDSGRTDLHKWNRIDQIRLNQIAALPGVRSVTPIYQSGVDLKDPDTGAIHRIVMFAFPPDSFPLDIGDRKEISRVLNTPGTVLYDRLSRPIYGNIRKGRQVVLDGSTYTVGGTVEIGADIVNDGAMVMSDGAWLNQNPDAQPIMGAINLENGVLTSQARARILAAMPPDILLLTPQELRQREIKFTLEAAPIGILFGIGVIAGLLIGAVTCYQILFTEITDRAKEYATLYALGFEDLFFEQVILAQALLLSIGGFMVGYLVAQLGYWIIAAQTAMAVEFTSSSTWLIFLLTAAMSAIAARAAMRPLALSDPADFS